MFDELVVPTVTAQADKRNIDKSRSKPLKYPKPIQAAHDNGAGTIPKGRKPVFVVEDATRLKFPFIRHQPAVLMDYRNVVDIVSAMVKKSIGLGWTAIRMKSCLVHLKRRYPTILRNQ